MTVLPTHFPFGLKILFDKLTDSCKETCIKLENRESKFNQEQHKWLLHLLTLTDIEVCGTGESTRHVLIPA